MVQHDEARRSGLRVSCTALGGGALLLARGVFGQLAPVKIAQPFGQKHALVVRQLAGQLMRLNSL